MFIKYKVTENDYLQLHLYHFDTEGLRKKTQKILYCFIAVILVAILILIYQNELIIAGSLVVVLLLISLFHKKNMKKKFEKIYSKCIQQYKNRFNTTVEVNFTESELQVKSVAAKTQFYKSQIKSITETGEYFFIGLQPEVLIIPKRELENSTDISNYLQNLATELKIDFTENFKWKW